ncbi:MAG: TetR/AcrR family transcriptional regulator [Bradyrhizobiaceae bacterium]|nr:TetR/AcrR family transcriptional regulator [Bradyrhizobiaceae bacterium]
MTDARITKTRAALAGAVIAFAGEKDFADVTISEIARRAGVGYATFFRHYPDKESLLADVADDLMEDLLPLMTPALLQDNTYGAALTLCRFVDARRELCRALLAGGTAAMLRQELVSRAIRRAEAVNVAHTEDVPRDLLLVHAVTATLGLLGWWLAHDGRLGVAAMAAVIDDLVIKPTRRRRED